MEVKRGLQGQDSLRQFWRWWIDELRTLVPGALAAKFAHRQANVQVVVEPRVTRIELLEAGESRLLTVVDLLGDALVSREDASRELAGKLPQHADVELFVDCPQILSYQVVLPIAAEANLGNVLRFEIDRLTPFKLEQAALAYRVVDRFPEIEKIRVEIFVMRRDWMESLLARVEQLGLTASAIYPAAEINKRETLNLLPIEKRPVREPLFNPLAQRLTLIFIVLLAVVLFYPAWHLSREADQIDEAMGEIRRHAAVVSEKQRLLAARLSAQDVIVARKNGELGKLQIIQEITELLPNNTWVSRFNIDDGSVTLQGESRKASDLIELLEKSRYFQNVRFASPITSNAGTNMERYEIRLDVGGTE